MNEEKKNEDKDPAESIMDMIRKYYEGIKKRENEGVGAD